MPVEIKELVIRTMVADDDESEEGGSSAVDENEIVEECVRQVLVILNRKNER